MTNEEAIEVINNLVTPTDDVHQFIAIHNALEMSIEALKNQRKKGKWERDVCRYICSNCKKRCEEIVNDGLRLNQLSDYCPNCGADMRGEKE